MEPAYFSLLKTWCDALIAHQLTGTGSPAFEGGLMCPACKMIHGRCPDAIYPMMYLADATGEEKYLRSARLLFDWGANMLCDDGSLYNDAHSTWNGITVFAAMGLCDALNHHGRLLDAETRGRWEARLRGMGEWLYGTLTMAFKTNVNYHASNACAMAMLGAFFDRPEYLRRARDMAHACLRMISPNGLLAGEGQPLDAVSPRGCLAVDVGYNVEESLPSLLRYARICRDQPAWDAVVASMRAHLTLMLPDGAWDNSFGTRNFKWTYWGSRTSDGCQGAFAMLVAADPVFGEAARRNLALYLACTHGGLLHGGRDYHAHGEPPCIHHTFCHAKVLAMALDEGTESAAPAALPGDTPRGLVHWPEVDTWFAGVGPWRADVTAYDFPYTEGGHASGGCLSLLWHERVGPLAAVGMTDYALKEPHNMQLSLRKAAHRCPAPRLELALGGRRYSNLYDTHAAVRARMEDGAAVIDVDAALAAPDGAQPPEPAACALRYRVDARYVAIEGRLQGAHAQHARLILPLIVGETAECRCGDGVFTARLDGGLLRVASGGLQRAPEPIFCLCPGFACRELVLLPDRNGAFAARIEVR